MTERLSLTDRSWPVQGRLTQVHVALYHATRGRVGRHIPGRPPILLLTHVGAKSGKKRTTTLCYLPHDGSFVVVGAKSGYPRNPGWVHNLRAFPDTEVQVGPDTIKVHAHEADPEERQRLSPEAARYSAAWGRYQQRTKRAFPLVLLTPRLRETG